MKKHIIFIHGAGEGAYKADQLLADSLQQKLGKGYNVIYPEMPDEENAPYGQWKDKLTQELAALNGHIFLVGHSIGASVIGKYLSDVTLKKPIQGIFLIANPFWGGDGWLYEGYDELELPEDFSRRLPENVPLFLYHCRDDEIVPFSHLALYSQLLPQAIVREIAEGGHQLHNNLSVVAEDIETHNL